MVRSDPGVELGERIGGVDGGVGEGEGGEDVVGGAGLLGGVLGVGAVRAGGGDDVDGLDVSGADGLHVGGGAEGGGVVVVIGRLCGIVCLRLTALNLISASFPAFT